MREKPPSIARLDRGLDRLVAVDRDHVGTRPHHLVHHRVAELEDRVDETSLLALDLLLVGGDVGHRAEVLLGDERPLLQALARQHHVRQPDEAARQQAQRREVGDGPEEARDAQRGAVGVLDRVGLRRDLADHEVHDDLQHQADEEPGAAERALEQRTEQRGARQLRDEHEEQHHVERLLGPLQHLRESSRALAALFLERERADPAHAGERGLGHREDDREEEQHDDGDEDRPVGAAHAAPRSPGGARDLELDRISAVSPPARARGSGRAARAPGAASPHARADRHGHS